MLGTASQHTPLMKSTASFPVLEWTLTWRFLGKWDSCFHLWPTEWQLSGCQITSSGWNIHPDFVFLFQYWGTLCYLAAEAYAWDIKELVVRNWEDIPERSSDVKGFSSCPSCGADICIPNRWHKAHCKQKILCILKCPKLGSFAYLQESAAGEQSLNALLISAIVSEQN